MSPPQQDSIVEVKYLFCQSLNKHNSQWKIKLKSFSFILPQPLQIMVIMPANLQSLFQWVNIVFQNRLYFKIDSIPCVQSLRDLSCLGDSTFYYVPFGLSSQRAEISPWQTFSPFCWNSSFHGPFVLSPIIGSYPQCLAQTIYSMYEGFLWIWNVTYEWLNKMWQMPTKCNTIWQGK